MNALGPMPVVVLLAGAFGATPVLAQHAGHTAELVPPTGASSDAATRKKSAKSTSHQPKQSAPRADTGSPMHPHGSAATDAQQTHHAAMGHAMPAVTSAASRTEGAAPAKAHSGDDVHAGHDMSSMPAMDMSGTDRGGMKHGATGQSVSDQGATAPTAQPQPSHAGHDMSSMPGMDMTGMDHDGMDHSSIGHTSQAAGSMDHDAMHGPAAANASKDLPAGATPREPIPPLTDADRAAAFPPLASGHATHDAMTHSFWLADRFEAREGGNSAAWSGRAWIGGDVSRLWLRSEGDVEDGRVERANLDVLYGRSVSPWWDVVAGVRHAFGEGPSRTYAAIGVQGMAPYKFEVEATAFVGEGGRTAATLEAEYDTLLTNRLILQWQGEANLYGRDDSAIGIGAGLATVEAGARLRYEVTRQFAPYVGVEVERAFGGTADLRREEGARASDTRIVAGIRFWF